MASLDLNTLNNCIVSLRGAVTQARVHVIHKLSRQITKLRSKKGNEEQKQKNERKAERFSQEIIFLKESQKDDLAKFAIRNKKELEQVLEKTDDLKTRALVRISCHEAVKKPVDKMRQKYPNWESEEQSLFARMGRVQNKKSPAVKMAKKLKQKTITLDKLRKKDKNIDKTLEEESSEFDSSLPYNVQNKSKVKQHHSDNESDPDEEKVESDDMNEGSVNDENEDRVNDDNKEDSNVDDDDDDDDIGEDSAVDQVDENVESDGDDEQSKVEEGFIAALRKASRNFSDKSENQDNEDPNQPKAKIYKRQGELEVKSINIKGHKMEEEIQVETSIRSLERKQVESNKKLGSFFMGGESSSENEEEETMDTESKSKPPNKINDLKRPKKDLIEKKQFRSNSRKKWGSFDVKKKHLSQEKSTSNPKLHPSWAAKRKMQSIPITEFKGKKIKFDQGNESRNSGFGKKSADKPKESLLHPSWMAKKAQQSKLMPFQGKKTTFD